MKKTVELSELFEPKYGVNLELINLERCKSTDPGAVPFVARTEKNNGVSAFVLKQPDIETNPKHTLSVAVSGSILSTFYQPLPYYSGRDLYVLIPKKNFSIVEMLFYAKYISANKYRYNYGRQANKTLKNILLPETPVPELLRNMSSYKNKLSKKINTSPILDGAPNINITNWQSFPISELFTITGTKTTPIHPSEEHERGMYPYVTTQATNNATESFYDEYTENGNVLTVDSAVIGYCSYQAINFSASDHVEKLIPNFIMNKYIAMFLVTIMNMEQYRYNYGRKASQTRLLQRNIKLPVKNGAPDWLFMENYIKSLPYSHLI